MLRRFLKRYRFYSLLLGLALVLSLTLFADIAFSNVRTGSTSSGTTGRGTSNIPFSKLSFKPLGAIEGPNRAIAFGTAEKGAHGFYLKLPAGFDSGLHYHNANYGAVVIEGTIENDYARQNQPVTLTKGGFFATDSKVGHVTRCLSKTECVVYVQMDRAFDAVPIRPSSSNPQPR
jgi:beta-alanine degradation protein BauB